MKVQSACKRILSKIQKYVPPIKFIYQALVYSLQYPEKVDEQSLPNS
jgi:hypothetical protein